ncbi:MAG TPA: hypothetical protein VGR47_03940 [Terracidiphilus sp.]|nr:hypothetical protein [Terracidiphilus sp.]
MSDRKSFTDEMSERLKEHDEKREQRRKNTLQAAQDWLQHGYDTGGIEEVKGRLTSYCAFLVVRRDHNVGHLATVQNAFGLLNRLEDHEQDFAQDFTMLMLGTIETFKGIDKEGGPVPVFDFVNKVFANFDKRRNIERNEEAYRFIGGADAEEDEDGNLSPPGPGTILWERAADITLEVPPEPDSDYIPEKPSHDQALGNLGWDTVKLLHESFMGSDDVCRRAIAEIIIQTGRVNFSEIARRLSAGEFSQADPANPVTCKVTHDKIRREIIAFRETLAEVYAKPGQPFTPKPQDVAIFMDWYKGREQYQKANAAE